MTWTLLDDGLNDNPLTDAGVLANAALGLWVRLCVHTARRTRFDGYDGTFTLTDVRGLHGTDRQFSRLADLGLVTPDGGRWRVVQSPTLVRICTPKPDADAGGLHAIRREAGRRGGIASARRRARAATPTGTQTGMETIMESDRKRDANGMQTASETTSETRGETTGSETGKPVGKTMGKPTGPTPAEPHGSNDTPPSGGPAGPSKSQANRQAKDEAKTQANGQANGKQNQPLGTNTITDAITDSPPKKPSPQADATLMAFDRAWRSWRPASGSRDRALAAWRDAARGVDAARLEAAARAYMRDVASGRVKSPAGLARWLTHGLWMAYLPAQPQPKATTRAHRHTPSCEHTLALMRPHEAEYSHERTHGVMPSDWSLALIECAERLNREETPCART